VPSIAEPCGLPPRHKIRAIGLPYQHLGRSRPAIKPDFRLQQVRFLLVIVLSNPTPRQPRRPLFLPGSAAARGSSKPLASPLRLFVQFRACGQLVTAPLFRLGLKTGIEAAIGAASFHSL
jgi:hypothetical protein